MSDHTIDTTTPVRTPGEGAAIRLRRTAAPPLPTGQPVDPAACRYYLSIRDGKVYAVELRDEWIPVRAAGPFIGTQLRAGPHEQDFSAAVDARKWNVATLVPLCEAERSRITQGVAVTASRAAPTPPSID